MTTSRGLVGVSGFLMLVTLATPGCATKKYVQQQTSPIQQRVEEVNKKHDEAIASLESKEQKDISRVEERAMGAENKANDAARAAQTADQHAQQAADSARNATQLAQTAQSKINDVSRAVDNIDNFKVIKTDDVLFGFDKAVLTEEARSTLDQVVQNTQGMPRYVVEVEGFTDKTGPREYNLALSRRRADAVVRYLVDKGVTLRRIHMIGLGATMAPMTDGNAMAQNTSESPKLTRKQQRRVIVRVYAPESTLSASGQKPANQ